MPVPGESCYYFMRTCLLLGSVLNTLGDHLTYPSQGHEVGITTDIKPVGSGAEIPSTI